VFIRRQCTHLCTPPILVIDTQSGASVVEGDIGDLWQCDECQKIWECRRTCAWPGRAWWKPSFLTRLWLRLWRHRDDEPLPTTALSYDDRASVIELARAS
jgi:hypothetical protein